ncbi:MAG: HlyD family type I secretion periplasmic adaptor subunit [Beijerinckiaceae bacterium]|nr:HlyD family type I secretion periplasmic adaptor subunit [Beijerinckiaceae bacterium]
MNEAVKPPGGMDAAPEAGPAATPRPAPPRNAFISGRDREFLPAALEILETPPSPLPVAMMLTLCGFMVVALAWAFIGRLDVHAVAPGKVEVNGRAKVIQPLDPGKISEIAVDNGARVKAGDLLVRFDETEAAADEKAYEDALLAQRAEIARRKTAIDAARSVIRAQRGVSTPAAFPNVDLFAAVDWSADDARTVPARLRDREEAVLAADLSQLADTLQNIAKQMAQKDATKERLTMSMNFQSGLIETLKARVGVREASIKLDVGTKINLFDAQEALQKSQSALASDQGQMIETEAALEELKSQRLKALSQFVADNQSKLAEAARKADETAQQLAKAKAKLARTRLVSPIDGTVQQLAVTTIGQVVTTGQQLMLITPDSGALQVEILVSNIDIGFIKIGQEASVKVDAFPFTRFGTLHGTVTRIASDAIDEQDAKRSQASVTALTNGGGSSSSSGAGQPQTFVFPVTLALSETVMKIDQAVVPITPGMTVVAEIKTDSRRVIDYLFSPLAKIGSEALRER